MNLQTPPPRARMSIDEFFAWVEHQDARHELVDGVPRLLPYVKLNHNRVVTRLVNQLMNQLNPTLFEPTAGDFAVEVGPQSVRFADVMVLPAGKPGEILRIADAILLVEVLSRSTMHVDFGPKLAEYQALESLDTYLIFSQDEPSVWRWTRDENGQWPMDPDKISAGDIRIRKIGVELPLAVIYRDLN